MSGSPNTATAFVETSSAPRATLSMPSVAMNGAIPVSVMSSPLPTPADRADGRPDMIAGMIRNLLLAIICAPKTPASAATAPTDRSIPAVMMTSVMPMAMIAVTAIWAPTLNRLSDVRNDDDANDRYEDDDQRARRGELRDGIRQALPRVRQRSVSRRPTGGFLAHGLPPPIGRRSERLSL